MQGKELDYLENYAPSQEQKRQLLLVKKILEECVRMKIEYLVVGGYGLDALYGKLTRNHGDLDIYIWERDKLIFFGLLKLFGFHPTGNMIGDAKKEEFSNKKDYGNFTIEAGMIDFGIKLLGDTKAENLLPSIPIGRLDDTPIWIPTLTGFKKLIEINNTLAVQNKSEPYRHKEWLSLLLRTIESKNSV